jgi:phosphoadenosine phosphosulfate reductase
MAEERRRLDYLTQSLYQSLTETVTRHERPIFTIALIAGDVVILDALFHAGLLDKVRVVFVDTFTLFPETLTFLREVEARYGFKALVYHAAGLENQAEFEAKHSFDYSHAADVEVYDQLCKVEPLTRALKEHNTDCWINGRRRDHGAERAALTVHEGSKFNPLAFWTFEDCWLYLRRGNVPYHPLHDDGFASIGDVQSTLRVPLDRWMVHGGERSGRFQNMKNADGSTKTECGIHSKKRPAKRAKTEHSAHPTGTATAPQPAAVAVNA